MCGIVGYIGKKKAFPILYKGLLSLEYRGYDSAGISTIEENTLSVLKNSGRVKNLKNEPLFKSLKGNIGIAHTRWATHGKPSIINAHPHLDNSKTFSVVHNGIIENFNELKNFLTNHEFYFCSETDTEVIPNLISYYYYKSKKEGVSSFLTAIKNACDKLIGSYAIEVISKDFPNYIIVAKKHSPLVIGKGILENYIASDIPAILEYTKNFYFIEDNEFATITKETVEFYDANLNKIEKELKEITWDSSTVNKNGYEDYMLKEIYEQSDSIRNTINSRLKTNGEYDFKDLNLSAQYLKSVNKIYIVACGTAMHAGLAVKNTIEKLCQIVTQVEIASEFRYKEPLIDSNTLCLFISQSGETADTLAALELSKKLGAKTIAISNVIGSSIARIADYSIFTHAGPEIAVASTKAYTSQVTLLTMFAIHLAETLGKTNIQLINSVKKEVLNLPEKVKSCLNNDIYIKEFAAKVFHEKDIFFLGRGIDYITALEGSLKLKEISYIHSEAYPSGELKHGPIALIEKGTTVISIITDKNLTTKSIANVQEVISRGAKTLIITNNNLGNNNFDNIINIPDIHPFISPIISIIPLQLLAYYISKNKELDVDKPRNLAKSVTVE